MTRNPNPSKKGYWNKPQKLNSMQEVKKSRALAFIGCDGTVDCYWSRSIEIYGQSGEIEEHMWHWRSMGIRTKQWQSMLLIWANQCYLGPIGANLCQSSLTNDNQVLSGSFRVSLGQSESTGANPVDLWPILNKGGNSGQLGANGTNSVPFDLFDSRLKGVTKYSWVSAILFLRYLNILVPTLHS